MKFIADIHVHSRYSRATSKSLGFESLQQAAQLKGITVVGTGDATHPGWISEIREKLEPAEPGLFKLKAPLADDVSSQVPEGCRRPVRFMLQSEISCIYKKYGRTRKNHHLVYFPDIESQERFNSRLSKIGNIQADGRPILGLDARDLLEVMLESNDAGVFIPAHIWTPWFSLLGSKSGFDGLEECFGDLASHIFAVETGLSSDPPMNRRVSWLDGLTLVSNSDAHSPAKLGREANLFDTDLSYGAIFDAVRKADPERFLGTIEFFPEEGKYHLDGHRKCGICITPRETKSVGGLCPACGKPLTLGVLYRVEELADRTEVLVPEKLTPFHSLIPLTDILAEVLRCGAGTKKVTEAYQRAVTVLGDEFAVLKDIDPERIDTAGIPLLGEAIRRMRQGNIVISAGYDGEFGKVRIFDDGEREGLMGQSKLFASYKPTKRSSEKRRTPSSESRPASIVAGKGRETPIDSKSIRFNPEQEKAIAHADGPILIVAGPGTGKTHTLTHRIARIIREQKALPEQMLAITFTTRAAGEMTARLKTLPGIQNDLPFTGTFHAFCLALIKEQRPGSDIQVVDDRERSTLINAVQHQMGMKPSPVFIDGIISAKQQMLSPGQWHPKRDNAEEMVEVYRRYQDLLSAMGVMDYEDIIFETVRNLETDDAWRQSTQERYPYLFIDEYQDLNHGQYRLVRLITRPDHNIFAIGDPDQSIYGFRGSDSAYFNRFVEDYPDAVVIRLSRNYRSTETILEASFQIIQNQPAAGFADSRLYSDISGKKTVGILEATSEKAEAVAIGRRIEELVGGLDFHSLDSRAVDAADVDQERSFADFAVFYRTRAQADLLYEVLTGAGIPCNIAGRQAVQDRKGIAEPLALLKLVEGIGGFMDVDRAVKTLSDRPTRSVLDRFRSWALSLGMTVEEALSGTRRIPIPDVSPAQQHRLVSLWDRIESLRSVGSNSTVQEKLHRTFDTVTVSADVDLKDVITFLIDLAASYGNDSKAFFTALNLQTDNDLYRSDAEKVTLMTMHASKGLEFPVVFVSGCETGLVPYKREGKTENDPGEERRLFYVAMTRAREQLYLTWSRKRTLRGVRMERTLSPFVSEIETRLTEQGATPARKQQNPGQVQLSLFQ